MLFRRGSRRISKRTARLFVRRGSDFGSGVSDRRVDGSELGDVAAEHRSKLRCLLIVRPRVAPCCTWVQQFGGHAGNLGRHRQTEYFVLLRPHLLELSGECCINHGARIAQFYPFAFSVWAACPSRVYQPDIRPMLAQKLAEQLGVLYRWPDEERSAKTCAESWLRLCHAALGAGDFRCVAGKEIVHRLVRRESGDRWQHAKRISSEKDDVAGMAAAAALDVVADVVQRIRCARVLGNG